MQQHLPVPDL